MKKPFVTALALALTISACLPAFSPTQSYPTPVSEEDLRGTAAVLSLQTLQALPSQTLAPTSTPVIISPAPTGTQPTVTETPNPALLTLTATLLAGTLAPETETATLTTLSAATAAASTGTGTEPTPTSQSTAAQETPQPLSHGTLPPTLPSGTVEFFNKSHAEAYISLRCVTKDGYVTILEYPVNKNFKVGAPAGSYTYVAWVGGRQFDGAFTLDVDGYATITLYKDRVNVKRR